ncbi:long-chain-fatty-acid--CoA ligase [Phycicoccus flavus]|uniref:Long-chain fatty acid--CoA ligase n=1 Tax=Phycicoccus flavus TaxID=2502783 RepID=A0A8T6R5V7_9MICO|nr:long-chain fatty acid--CoA ligase [Phycicoccus flavus]NHA68850.1 long-chain fatty acid--CoA ligase [Phycicoccus flavus]
MATLSLAVLLAESARRRPDGLAVVEGDRRTDYATLWQDALRVAADLRERGVGPGTRVALLAPNVTGFVTAYYGILAAGGVVVPVPTLLGAREIGYVLRHSGARVLLRHDALADLGGAAADEVGIPAVSLAGLGDGAEPLRTYVSRDPSDTAVVFYTSGTTGLPKGALLTHLNLVMNATTNAFDGNEIRRDDVVMGSLPLFHVYGQSVAMNTTFRLGTTLVLQPRFHAAEAIDLMVREGATIFMGVPTMYVQLLEAAKDAERLPALRDCVSGGASLPVVVLERFEEVFGTPIHEGYGLSETSPTATSNQRLFGRRAGTIGHPIWGVEVEIANEAVPERIELRPTGERGEVVVRGHNVFAGYLDDDDATAAVMVDGWFRTGDIGVKDEEGFVRIVDRTKDLVIRGGFNVYPRDVEDVLSRHEAVGQVAVIGLPDEVQGEEVCAVVVPADGATLDPDELVAWSRERLGKHKYPRRVEVVDALPLGPSMKVLKRELRARFSPPAADARSAAPASASPPADPPVRPADPEHPTTPTPDQPDHSQEA